MVRRLIGAGAFFLFSSFALWAQISDESILARMKKDLFFLAAPESEGRGPGTKGIDRAADYIAGQFAEAGLKPGAHKDGFFQHFTITGQSALGKSNRVALKGQLGQAIELRPDKDFNVMGLSGKGTATGPLVFIGHGIRSKEHDYDDYAGLDVKDKIVVMLRHTPRWGSSTTPFGGKDNEMLAALERKIALAESLRAKAVMLVNDVPELGSGDMLTPFSYLAAATSSSIPCVHVKRSAIDPVFQCVFGMSLRELEQAIDRDLKPRGADLTGWKATVETNVSRVTIPVKNVVGVIEGAGPLAKETLVVGAHYDHLGFGGKGSLSKKPSEKQIHHGADDNASGTTAMIELARRAGALASGSSKDASRRRLVFIAFSAEERGLLGSQHYCNKDPLFPLESTAAMVNLDMVGRMRPDAKSKLGKLIVQGVGTSKGFDAMVEDFNNPGFSLVKLPQGLGPSDHASFYQKKIPVLFFWTGTHEDYHKPSDTAERINLDGMKQITDYVEKVVKKLATDPDRPEYVLVASPKTPAMKGPRLGITPNYESDKEGVLVGGVADDGPAAKGGVKTGDRIVEIAGQRVTSIETYMVIMGQQKVGRPIPVGVIRDGKKVELKVTP